MEAQSEMDDYSKCVLCESGFTEASPTVVVHQKGLTTLIRVRGERNLKDLKNYFQQIEDTGEKILVHHDCRQSLVDKRKQSDEGTFPVKNLRSSLPFNWKLHCFLCRENATGDTGIEIRLRKL